MNPEYLNKPAPGRDRWMVSYLDVITILLVFFLAAAARGLNRPAGAAATAPPPQPAANRTPEATNNAGLLHVQQLLRDRGLLPVLEPRGLVIDLPQLVLFSSGDDTVNPEALPILSNIADVLRDFPGGSLSVIGHADTLPIHNRRFHDNWELSTARSLRIVELLNARYGVAGARLSITAFGPYRPSASNDTREGRASNRRVEILITDTTSVPN